VAYDLLANAVTEVVDAIQLFRVAVHVVAFPDADRVGRMDMWDTEMIGRCLPGQLGTTIITVDQGVSKPLGVDLAAAASAKVPFNAISSSPGSSRRPTNLQRRPSSRFREANHQGNTSRENSSKAKEESRCQRLTTARISGR